MCVFFTLRSLLSPFLLCYAFLLLSVSWLPSSMRSHFCHCGLKFPKSQNLTSCDRLPISSVPGAKPVGSIWLWVSLRFSLLVRPPKWYGKGHRRSTVQGWRPTWTAERRLMLPWAGLSQRRFSSAQTLGSHASRKSRLRFSTYLSKINLSSSYWNLIILKASSIEHREVI